MPLLKTPEMMIGHLREVVRGCRRVALVTNHTAGHEALCDLAIRLTEPGREDDLFFGVIHFHNPPTGHREDFSVLSLSRRLLTPTRELAVCQAARGTSYEIHENVIGMMSEPADLETFLCLVLAVSHDALWPTGVAADN